MADKSHPALLRLLQLCSPALPVGAYAYSQGLEHAVHLGWVANEEQSLRWLAAQLHESLLYNDAAIFHRLFEAATQGDETAFLHWDRMLFALRETAELRKEEQDMSAALRRLLNDLGVVTTIPLAALRCYLSHFVLAGVAWNIEAQALLSGFLWSWCENQVAAAIKLVPLGQTSGQRLLLQLAEAIDEVASKSQQLAAEDIGRSLPAVVMASSWHEQQYSRLFRS